MEGVLRTPLGLHVLKDDWILSRWVEQEGRLDRGLDEVRLIAPYLSEGAVVVNAGASLGDHACIYSQVVGVTGHVYAYEPHPLAFHALQRNMARFNNVTVSSLGLGDVDDEQVILFQAPDQGCSCVMTPDVLEAAARMKPQFGGEVFPMTKAPITLTTLDTHLLPRLNRCDLLHLDAEGLEPRILKGATALLAKFRPLLVLEMWPGHLARWGITPLQFEHMLDYLGYVRWVLNTVEIDLGEGLPDTPAINVIAFPKEKVDGPAIPVPSHAILVK